LVHIINNKGEDKEKYSMADGYELFLKECGIAIKEN